MKNTSEQDAVIECDTDLLRVDAFAGTGKTTTLVGYARRRPRRNILYLAFNQSIKAEAKRKFPNHVKCFTSHGLAWWSHGVVFDEAKKLVKGIRVHEVVDALSLDKYPQDFALYVADAAMRMVRRFIVSDRMELAEDLAAGLVTPGSGLTEGDVTLLAHKLWSMMTDPRDSRIGIEHDGYLKLFQLSRPVLDFDDILFDEYQDANPVTAQLVRAQDARKVAVGDCHQQLYSFRGAVNALETLKPTRTLHLTKSFRFGQGIADVANLLLSTFKNETRAIQGTEEPSHIGYFSANLPHAVIARSNATLFEEATQAIARGRNVHFVGGIGGYRIGDALDAYNLWTGETDRIVNPHLRSFQKFDRMMDYAGAVDDRELKSLARLVKKHSSKIPYLVGQIRAGNQEEAANADVILTTAHKAKGLEFLRVRLADDFVDLFDDAGKVRKLDAKEQEEINILYVAASRARHSLSPCPQLEKLLAMEKAKARVPQLPEWARPAQSAPMRANARR